MRYERPQKGREREFWQLNVDVFGSEDTRADIEVITIADAILREFGAGREMYTTLVGDRRLTDYIMREYLGLDATRAGAMVKLFDRHSKITTESFESQVAEIVKENISETLIKIKKIADSTSLDDLPSDIMENAPVGDLQKLLATLRRNGITNAKYDPMLMRGFDYYTGIVFEVFDNAPENNRAMFGGGRYDGLIGLFGVEDLPVVGFAPGETTTIEFLKAWNLLPDLKPATNLILIPLGDIDTETIANQLRAGGVNVAVDFTDRKIDKKIRVAVKTGVQYLLFIGEDEINSGQYTLKNLATENEQKLTLDDVIDAIAKKL
jgi:histidyl-tRNA synthetase